MGAGRMIIFQDVCNALSQSREVLRRINWCIRTGEHWLISGASGIGKTTLLRLLMGLDTPDSGMVTGTDGLRFAPVFQEDRLVEHWSTWQMCRWFVQTVRGCVQC